MQASASASVSAANEAEAKRKAEAEATKRKAEEAEAKRQAEAEATKRKAVEAEAKRKAEVDAKRKADEAEAKRKQEVLAAVSASIPSSSAAADNKSPADISALLTSLGLADYINKFRDEEITVDVLIHLSENDLEKIGLKVCNSNLEILSRFAFTAWLAQETDKLDRHAESEQGQIKQHQQHR